MIDIKDLYAGYGLKPVLKGINLVVKPGESVGIAGPNGAGKSTLFKAILGIIPVQRGHIQIMGRTVRDDQDRGWVRRQIGYVPQQTLPGKLPVSVHDAVLMGRWGKGFGFPRRPGQADRRMVKEILLSFGLIHKEYHDCRTLSGGEQQKLAIARALIREAAILLLDEPATFLDQSSRNEITQLIHQIRAEQNLTMIIISHEPVHLQVMADRVYQIANGCLRMSVHESY